MNLPSWETGEMYRAESDMRRLATMLVLVSWDAILMMELNVLNFLKIWFHFLFTVVLFDLFSLSSEEEKVQTIPFFEKRWEITYKKESLKMQ
jgi:Ca2+/Na+ antiporter